MQTKHTSKKKPSKSLPSDSNTTIQGKPRSWLTGFLTASEIASSGILWSDSTQRLWFPIRREGIQHGWTGRYFGSDDKPKYSTIVLTEPSELFSVRQAEGHTVIVEDYISYYKLLSNSNYNIICLYGTNYKHKVTSYLTDTVYIFFDNDNSIVKSKQTKLRNLLQLLVSNVTVIHSNKDPKEHTVEELHEIFNSIQK